MSIQPALQKDINPLIKNVKIAVASHELKTGAYSRWIQPDPSGKTNRELGINEYGCADAANLLYTIGHFPQAPQERAQWIETLQSLQNPKTGLFTEATHHPIHTTAHCIAALELFDAVPIHPLSDLAPYKTKEGLYGLLEGLRWKDSPWDNSHQGAGIFAAMNLSGEATPQWNRWYFDWFWQEADPETGLWRKGCVTAGPARRFEHMAGSFHYLFNHEYARMPLRYPEKMIDTCLDMYGFTRRSRRSNEKTDFLIGGAC